MTNEDIQARLTGLLRSIPETTLARSQARKHLLRAINVLTPDQPITGRGPPPRHPWRTTAIGNSFHIANESNPYRAGVHQQDRVKGQLNYYARNYGLGFRMDPGKDRITITRTH
jgi:hypothetical protein